MARISDQNVFAITAWPILFHVVKERNGRFSVAQASACVVLICGKRKSKEHRLKPVLLKTFISRTAGGPGNVRRASQWNFARIFVKMIPVRQTGSKCFVL
jgi:hypothetical protein